MLAPVHDASAGRVVQTQSDYTDQRIEEIGAVFNLGQSEPVVRLPHLPGAVMADPLDAIDRRETQLAISAALAELPPDQREAVMLVDVEGWSIEDAARQLGCPPGTVKSRCFRGRAKLAKRLDYLRNLDRTDSVTPSEGGESTDG